MQRYNSLAITGSKPIKRLIVYILMYVYLMGLFRANEINHSTKLFKLRISTGRRQTSWLPGTHPGDLKEADQVLPGTNPAGGPGGT